MHVHPPGGITGHVVTNSMCFVASHKTSPVPISTHNTLYSETSLIRHSMGTENNVGLGGCWIMECLLPYLCMVTVPRIMVGLERLLDYRGVRLVRFHCM